MFLAARSPASRVAGGRLTGVETDSGLVETGAAVVAAGPWTNWLSAPLGELLPITPLRVQMVHLRRPPPLESLTPTIIDQTSGSYYRLNSGLYTLMGGEAPEDMGEVVNPEAYGLNADHDTITRYWQRARLRFPDFAATTPQGGYGSLYDMTPDGNPILDKSRHVEGLYWSAGFRRTWLQTLSGDWEDDGRFGPGRGQHGARCEGI